jgi:hypothetical protein
MALDPSCRSHPARGRLARCATLAAVALVVAGCSSGGGDSSTPTTTGRSTTSLGVPVSAGRGTGPLDVAANLAPCPKTYPSASLIRPNANVSALGTKMVPIEALNVRVCKYATTPGSAKNHLPAQLIGSAALSRPAAAAFTEETNRLPIVPRRDFGCGSGSGPEPIGPGPTFVLTFAGHSRQFTLIEDFARSGTSRPSACVVGNGVISARPTTKWSNELQLYTNPHPIGFGLRMGPGMLTGPTGPTGPVSPAPTGAG